MSGQCMGAAGIRAGLEEFLYADVPDLAGKEVWIWGTGNTALLYQEGFRRLKKEGFVIEGYCDNYRKDTTFQGLPVLTPSELAGRNAAVLICSPQPDVVSAVGKQMDAMGKEWHPLDEVILKMHREQVLQVFDFLEDDRSKEVYASVIRARAEGKNLDEGLVSAGQYFILPPFLRRDAGEVYVDCGAYMGEDIERYLFQKEGVFRRIYAFEPDEGNFQALQRRTARLRGEWNLGEDKIQLFPYGIGGVKRRGSFLRMVRIMGSGASLWKGKATAGSSLWTGFWRKRFTF